MENKFRVWSKEKKQMFYLCEEGTGNYGIQLNNSSWGVFDYDGEPGVCICNSHFGDILMRYTGYIDSNKKRIYEGDIVDFRHGERNLCINFNAGQWNLCTYSDKPNFDYRNLDHYIKHDGPIAVIGNIYENLDLLKNNPR